jgi:hypothetical protein
LKSEAADRRPPDPNATSPQEDAMNKRYELSPRSNAADFATGSILAIIVAMTISTAAPAEYRYSTRGLLTLWEQRACELARQDTPDALIHYINRMNTISAGLYIDDYVGKADSERWELARQKTRLEQLRSATATGSANSIEKAK